MENVMKMVADKTGMSVTQTKDVVNHAVDYVKGSLPLLGAGMLTKVKANKLMTSGVLLALGLGAYYGYNRYNRMKNNSGTAFQDNNPRNSYPYQA